MRSFVTFLAIAVCHQLIEMLTWRLYGYGFDVIESVLFFLIAGVYLQPKQVYYIVHRTDDSGTVIVTSVLSEDDIKK